MHKSKRSRRARGAAGSMAGSTATAPVQGAKRKASPAMQERAEEEQMTAKVARIGDEAMAGAPGAAVGSGRKGYLVTRHSSDALPTAARCQGHAGVLPSLPLQCRPSCPEHGCCLPASQAG